MPPVIVIPIPGCSSPLISETVASEAPRTMSGHDGREIELMAAAKGNFAWGIASLVLLLAGRGFGEYNLYVVRPHWQPVDLVLRR